MRPWLKFAMPPRDSAPEGFGIHRLTLPEIVLAEVAKLSTMELVWQLRAHREVSTLDSGRTVDVAVRSRRGGWRRHERASWMLCGTRPDSACRRTSRRSNVRQVAIPSLVDDPGADSGTGSPTQTMSRCPVVRVSAT